MVAGLRTVGVGVVVVMVVPVQTVAVVAVGLVAAGPHALALARLTVHPVVQGGLAVQGGPVAR